MATYEIINSGLITIGSATISPTEGNPAGQIKTYNRDGTRTFSSIPEPVGLGRNFGYELVDASMSDSLEDASSYIATTGVSQEVFPEKSGRNYFYFRNNSTGIMYLNFGADADTTSSYKIDAGSELVFENNFVPLDTVNVFSTELSGLFVAKQA